MESLFFEAIQIPKNLNNINVSFGETLVITVFAMGVVFAVLIFLMFIIMIETKLLNSKSKKETQLVQQTKENIEETSENDEEIVAAIMGALSANIGVPVNKLNVKSIRRINNNFNWRNSNINSNLDLR